MPACTSCSAENPDTNKFCSECGVALSPEYAATVMGGSMVASEVSSLSNNSHHGRFLPGTRIAGRYRIVSLVGKGGMGEVYRADDLKLGHTVALKFLPDNLGSDPQRLEYFHTEVRLTRQISHPNVCRVYDIGEVDGQQFLSMEYVDGEDLKFLLRRIGRLPRDKGVDIARQLCAGLAAAHGKGVLHRDLKPANIMLDGRGQVRITDFGLAKLEEEDGKDGEVAGTPAYMAPEQLARGETTTQSDLYSLGLIMYELFTGEAAYQGRTYRELLKSREESLPSHPSALIDDMDPVVERVILRCLERQPHERPNSAHAIAAALPGGDPLAEALAAGETPSPEMVAVAGESGQLPVKNVVGLFAGICLVLVANLFLGDYLDRLHLGKFVDRPLDLRARATGLVTRLGYDARPKVEVQGFRYDKDQQHLDYWFRQHSRPLIPNIPPLVGRPSAWRITDVNPPFMEPGMVGVRLDPSGKPLVFVAVTDENSATGSTGDAPDWEAALDEYGLQVTESLNSASTNRAPPVPYDHSELRQTSDGASLFLAFRQGRLVYLHRSAQPDLRASSPAEEPSSYHQSQPWRLGFGSFNLIVVIFIAAGLALRNLRRGRADTRGGLRFALYFFTIDLVIWVVAVHHDGSPQRELDLGLSYLVRSLAYAFRVWLYYIAFEPIVRRFWPDMLISWSRLLSGRFQDPRIGRDILVGILCAASLEIIMQPFAPVRGARLTDDVLLGGRFVLSAILGAHQAAAASAYFNLTYLLIARLLFPKTWQAVAAFALMLPLAWWQESTIADPRILTYVMFAGVKAALFIRFGLLCVAFYSFTDFLFISFPLSINTQGYSTAGMCALAVLVAVGACGLYTSTLAGRTLISEPH